MIDYGQSETAAGLRLGWPELRQQTENGTLCAMIDDQTPADLLASDHERRAGDLEVIRWLIKIDSNQRSMNDVLTGHIAREEAEFEKLKKTESCVVSLAESVDVLRALLPADGDVKELLAEIISAARENKNVVGGIRVQIKRALLIGVGVYAISRVWPAAASWLKGVL